MDRTERDASPQPQPATGVAETSATFEDAHPVLRSRAVPGQVVDWDAMIEGIQRRFPKTLARLAE